MYHNRKRAMRDFAGGAAIPRTAAVAVHHLDFAASRQVVGDGSPEVKDLGSGFPFAVCPPRRISDVKAVDGVSSGGEVKLGWWGKRSGKTTVGRALLKLQKAHRGEVFFEGKNILL
jgi:ABC-type glutathione transport system ATPase component